MAGGGKENSMSDCLFCNIANHELESSYIYEDDMIVAFNDIQPQAPVHFLVVPKKHIQSLDALTDEDRELVAHIMLKIPELAKEQGIENGYRVVVNNGPDAFQEVKHLHFHVLGKRKMTWPPG